MTRAMSRVQPRTTLLDVQAEGGDAGVMDAIDRSLMEACIAYEHREFARLREPALAGSAA